MIGFLQRILLTVWLTIILSVALTLLAASLLGRGENPPRTLHDEQLISLFVRDLRAGLAQGRPAEAVIQEHVLDFGRFLKIFVVDPNHQDLLSRPLPPAVARHFKTPGHRDGRLIVHDQDLDGLTVVGYLGTYPLVRAMSRPGARLILALVAILVSASVSLLLARFVTLPVQRLRQAGERLANGDFSVRVGQTVGNRSDDLAGLARDFDSMASRIQSLLESQQRLIRDVSHELRSPLARLQALISLERQQGRHDQKARLDRMESELERLGALIGGVLTFAKLESESETRRQRVNLVEILENIVASAEIEGQVDGKNASLTAVDPCFLLLDSAQIERAIENIVRNALRHSQNGSTIEITVVSASTEVIVTIDDDGPGVPREALTRIFEPFFRVETARSTISGTGGIGLAIARRIIESHGGRIQAMNRATGGLRVEVRLPKTPSD